nr:nucleotide-binding, alpha-beta plait [Tanacetum cinerariifolium]
VTGGGQGGARDVEAALYIGEGNEHEEELTPNDENDDTGVSQEDDKDFNVGEDTVKDVAGNKTQESSDAVKSVNLQNQKWMRKMTWKQKRNRLKIMKLIWKRRKWMKKKIRQQLMVKSNEEPFKIEEPNMEVEKTHNEELKAEDDRQERLCFSDEEKDKDMDEDELTNKKREEHGGRDARRRVVIENASKMLSKLTMEAKVAREYKYCSLSKYARVGRALALYDVEEKNAAIAEIEYVSISLKAILF